VEISKCGHLKHSLDRSQWWRRSRVQMQRECVCRGLNWAGGQGLDRRLHSEQAHGILRGNGLSILVGTASWSDPEFVRDWYPKGLPAHERLQFYAERFQMVELNSSFYGIPQPRQVDQWSRSHLRTSSST